MEEVIEVPEFNNQLSEMMKQRFPFLRGMDDLNKHYQRLVVLLHEVAKTNPAKVEKYEFLYKVVEIGNLVETLLGKPIVELKPSNLDFHVLPLIQQTAQFRLSRNLCGHFGHILYEENTQYFLRNYVSLCQGDNISQNLSMTLSLTKKVKRSTAIVKILYSDESLFKLLAQMIYFLDKTALLLPVNAKAAEMAFIFAGNCAKDFNLYLCEQMKPRGVKNFNSKDLVKLLVTLDTSHIRALLLFTINLHNERNPFAHCYTVDYEAMTDELRRAQLKAFIIHPENELSQIKIIVQEYFIRKREGRVDEIFGDSFENALARILTRQNDESPRSYDRAVFRK